MLNEWLTTMVTFFAGIGIGSVISELIQKNYENKKLIFETKLPKYSNLIEALQNSVVDPSQNAKQITVSAQKQIELISTEEIIMLSKKFYETSKNNFSDIRDALVKAMRKDLKKYYN